MKKVLSFVLVLVFILQINACKKEKEGPSINSFSLLPNDTIPFVPGVYNKYSFDVTLNAILAGKFALITPVMILTEGL